MNEVNFRPPQPPVNPVQSKNTPDPQKLKSEQTNCLLLIFKLIGEFFSDLISRITKNDSHTYKPIAKNPKITETAGKVIVPGLIQKNVNANLLTESEKAAVNKIFLEDGGIENSSIETVRKLILEPAGNKLLMEFAKKCYQTESMEFLNAVAEFEKNPILENYNQIYATFIKPGSSKEINLPNARPNENVGAKELADPEKAKQLFKGAKKEIEGLLDINFRQRMGEFIVLANQVGVLSGRERSGDILQHKKETI